MDSKNFKHEYDEKNDVMTVYYSDAEPVKSESLVLMGTKNVFHLDADGNPARVEFHEYSKMEERAKASRRETFTSECSGERSLGSIRWIAYERGNEQSIAEGTAEPKLAEVLVELTDRENNPLLSKTVPLNDEFSLSINGSVPESGTLMGFAIQGKRTNETAFCWEWFQIDSPGHAIKIQEQGSLEFELATRGGLVQITKIVFPTDISLRVSRMNFDSTPTAESVRDNPDWRVNILKGSTMKWPCLVDGRVEI